jgi:Zn-dependent protease with chaperone function
MLKALFRYLLVFMKEFGMKFSMIKLLCMLFTMLFCALPLPHAEAAMISQQQEISMGESVAKQLENQYGLYQDDEVQARIDRIGRNLIANAARKDLPYTFKVLNTQDVNALACPGGFIYVYKGLVDFMTSDDELAAVLGHEIGHIEKRHTVHQIEKQMALSLLTILAGAASGDPGAGMVLATTASQALMASYSRGDEQEADAEGFVLAQKAGYNPYGSFVTMAKLEDMTKDMGNPGYGLFSSHPDPESRMKKAMDAASKLHMAETVSVDKDGTATVKDGNWSYTFRQTVGYDKPEYRARLMAGALYLAETRGPVDESHFITVDGDNWSDVYYEDIRIMRVYPQDVLDGNVSGAAARMAESLQHWAAEQKKRTVGKTASSPDKMQKPDVQGTKTAKTVQDSKAA